MENGNKGFNLFTDDDQKIFETIASEKFNISGFQNKNLRAKLAHKTTAQISIIIKRLRTHGLVKKIGHSYKYYLTKIGRNIITAELQLKELFLIPKLAQFTTEGKCFCIKLKEIRIKTLYRCQKQKF